MNKNPLNNTFTISHFKSVDGESGYEAPKLTVLGKAGELTKGVEGATKCDAGFPSNVVGTDDCTS